ncbi:HipA domain-containing protein [Bowmanella dokdonensis]|uniref:HipA domain-containing protein n=1 Tax=Bowmanella dokdonensis TaxID=751969 RepID=A0A939DND0_9ALTE|nr:HipA domain-containing protein [Bowmanella dokdonensis]MBN7825759.1 HipA domain-containing protein [Bowmanella dokdonensis]
MTGADKHPTLEVYFRDEPVAELIFSQPRACQLQYTTQWQQTGYPLSPHLPLSGEAEASSVINFLRNLFPEGSALELLLETQHLSKSNLYGILRTIGSDPAGALSFFSGQPDQVATDLRAISDEEVIARLSSANPHQIATWDGKYRLSVAGVQNKLNVYVDERNRLFLAQGRYSSTHILKFASDACQTIVLNEYFCMRLAKAVGLPVAEVSLRRFGEYDALLVERFDRKRHPNGVDKRHIIDGCQALDMPPEYKYEHNFGGGRDVRHIRDGASLVTLFSFAKQCAVPALTIQQMLDWMSFNLLIGNSDAHGKNISFLVNPNGITLAPFYDLVSVLFEAQHNPSLDTELAMAIGDNFDIHRITAYDLLSLAQATQLEASLLKRRLDRMANLVRSQTDQLKLENLQPGQQALLQQLGSLIHQRTDKLLAESRQFKAVARDAF